MKIWRANMNFQQEREEKGKKKKRMQVTHRKSDDYTLVQKEKRGRDELNNIVK